MGYFVPLRKIKKTGRLTMSTNFSVSLSQINKEMSFESVFMPTDPDTIMISSTQLNRPGVELTGFFDYYDNTRILMFGNTEMAYLGRLSDSERYKVLNDLLSRGAPALVLCRSFKPLPEMLEIAKKYSVPILSTSDQTSNVISSLVAYLNVELAPRITRHGVLVEVYGEGMLLIGDSGVGKSETAIELVKRGHRLIADDAVEIRKVSNKTLVGTSPENIRHFVEVRGVGIINARRLFGMGAVKLTEKIDLVVNMEQWDSSKTYDRMGMDNELIEILGIRVPIVTIPVKPGRNLAIIIEVAAMNNRQKKMGYNAATELLSNLGMSLDNVPPAEVQRDWNAF